MLTRFTVIYLNSYTEKEFVEIAVRVLERQEGVESEIAMLIAEAVFNKLKNTNIRECVRIARLANDDLSKVQSIFDTFVKYTSK